MSEERAYREKAEVVSHIPNLGFSGLIVANLLRPNNASSVEKHCSQANEGCAHSDLLLVGFIHAVQHILLDLRIHPSHGCIGLFAGRQLGRLHGECD